MNYGVVEYVDWQQHQANTAHLPNPIKYVYMKSEQFKVESELRVSLSALGIGHFVLQDGSRLAFAPSLQVPPTPGDTIVQAVCPAQFIKVAKAIIDTTGHYSRPDIFKLTMHAQPYQQQAAQAISSLGAGELNRVADANEVSRQDIESAAARMLDRASASGNLRTGDRALKNSRKSWRFHMPGKDDAAAHWVLWGLGAESASPWIVHRDHFNP